MTQNSENILLPGEKAVPVGELVKVIDNSHGLPWGTDAYLLASYIRRHRRCCELGSGSGVISFLLAAHGKAGSVTAVELNADAADRTSRGIVLNGLEDKVTLLCRDIRTLRYTDPDVGGRFDCVFSNPPYISHPGLKGKDGAEDDARHENNGTIRDFCLAAAAILNHRGSFYCVFRPERAADLFEAMRGAKIEPKRATLVFPDADSAPFLLLCEGILGGAPGLSFSAPLIFYREGKNITPRVMTERMAKIYSECSF